MILVLNCGSSSIKFQVIDPDTRERLISGLLSEIGSARARFAWQRGAERGEASHEGIDYQGGIALILETISGGAGQVLGSLAELRGIGHRVVHGGEAFTASTLITPEVIAAVEAVVPLAPLHNPANLLGIRVCQEALPETPQVAVFDTAFHQTLPEQAYLYAIPYHFYDEHRLRRYGFHGTSHRYVSERAMDLLRERQGKDARHARPRGNFISLHLGNGCSVAAIRAGRSVDTSMGLTPLEGLVMGTRSGDVDPSLLNVIAEREGLTAAGAEQVLNKQSGLLGLSGGVSDMRVLLEQSAAGDAGARRALEVFAYRAKKYIGAYLAVLGEVEAIIFTGGIGENAAPIREMICAGLAPLGIEMDVEANRAGRQRTFVQTEQSRVAIMVVPTDEELMIALDTARIIGS